MRQSYFKPQERRGMALFLYQRKKEEREMSKNNGYATNKSGVIKAPKPVKDNPRATVVKGGDLRDGKKTK